MWVVRGARASPTKAGLWVLGAGMRSLATKRAGCMCAGRREQAQPYRLAWRSQVEVANGLRKPSRMLGLVVGDVSQGNKGQQLKKIADCVWEDNPDNWAGWMDVNQSQCAKVQGCRPYRGKIQA
ncbi:hypothetical protein ACFX1Z_021311 [Malus domestica]